MFCEKIKYKLNAYVYSNCGINRSVNRLYENLKVIKKLNKNRQMKKKGCNY